jgi:hypothetical protein
MTRKKTLRDHSRTLLTMMNQTKALLRPAKSQAQILTSSVRMMMRGRAPSVRRRNPPIIRNATEQEGPWQMVSIAHGSLQTKCLGGVKIMGCTP